MSYFQVKKGTKETLEKKVIRATPEKEDRLGRKENEARRAHKGPRESAAHKVCVVSRVFRLMACLESMWTRKVSLWSPTPVTTRLP